MASEDVADGKGNGRPESFISNETTNVSTRPISRKPIPGAEDRDSHESKPFIDVNIGNSPEGTVDPDVTKEVHSSTEYSNSSKCGLVNLADVALPPRVLFITGLLGPID
jgi:hypothetical protein